MNNLETRANLGKSGYAGKDSMRESAKRQLHGDLDVPMRGSYMSASAPEYEKTRLYKKGGSVKAAKPSMKSKSRTLGDEMHIPGMVRHKKPKQKDFMRNSGALPTKADKMKKESATKMEGITPSKRKKGPMKFKKGGSVKGGESYHEMIGEHPKGMKYSGGKKQPNNTSVKAPKTPYDASHGQLQGKTGKSKRK